MKKTLFPLLFILLNNFIFAQVPPWLWAKRTAGTTLGAGNAVVTDSGGNIYVAGYFKAPTVSFGGIILTNANNSSSAEDIFVVKYSSAGDVLWAKRAGGGSSFDGRDVANAICLDPLGNVYVSGYFSSGTLYYDGISVINNSNTASDVYTNPFLLKLDSSGNLLWGWTGGGFLDDLSTGVAADSKGNVYITGAFSSNTVNFSGHVLTSSGYYDVFLSKLDSAGNMLWTKQSIGSDLEYATAVKVNSFDQLFVTGYYRGPSIIFGTDTALSVYPNKYQTFLVSYDTTGTVKWLKTSSGGNNDYSNSVTTGPGDEIYITGQYQSPVFNYDTLALTNTLNNFSPDVFLIKFDTSGTVQWGRTLGGKQEDYGSDVTCDIAGNVIVCGSFTSDTIHVGGTDLINAGSIATNDIAIYKYNASGAFEWATSVGNTSYDFGYSVATDLIDGIIITGSYKSLSISFGSTTLPGVSSDIFYIAKMGNLSTGIAERNNSFFNIYPNPTQDHFFIELDREVKNARIKIVDVKGNAVYNQTFSGSKLSLTGIHLSAGTYIIQVIEGTQFVSGKKIVVQ